MTIMIGTISEIGDTDYDTFKPNVSPVSIQSNESSEEGSRDDGTFNAFHDNGSLLGVIVDRSSFDEDDELTTYGRDANSVMHRSSLNLPQHQQLGLDMPLGGVVMRNGKVRRKMRWKPRFGKKKSNNFSSNASVVSALTNRSSSTSRSSSTTRSFLSHFSKRSGTSFHTFSSTETPVATNKANGPRAPHTVMRPNYQDSFDAKASPKHATIENGGTKYMHRPRKSGSSQYSVSSSSGFPSTKLDSVIESSPAEQLQEEVEVNSSSPLSTGTAMADDRNSSSKSVVAKSTKNTMSKATPLKPPTPLAIKSTKSVSQQQPKPRRPPLFKRRLRTSKNSKYMSTYSSPVSSPTDTNSTASLSSAVSLERENSGLPVLLGDDEDRRVHIDVRGSLSRTEGSQPRIQTALKTNKSEDDIILELNPEETSVSPTIQSSLSDSVSGNQSIQSGSSAMLTRNTTPVSLQKRISSIIKKRSTSSTSASHSSASPNRGLGSSTRSIGSPASPVEASVTKSIASFTTPHKKYNRPLSTTNVMAPGNGNGAEESIATPNTNPTGKFAGRRIAASVPCDLDEGAFLEAEHNLRAIHDMAAEHLAHGEYEEAADVFEEILRGQQERYGQDHYRVGTALHNLGIVYLKKGDYERAIEICQRAVDVRKDSLVPNHPDVAVSLAQLGVAHLESQNYHEALAAFRDALNIRRTFLGPRHMKCSKILNNIGCALYSVEDLSAAKRAFDEALEIQREGLRSLPSKEGGESIGTQSNTLLLSMASTLCNIGSIRLRWGDFVKAEIALEEALLIQQSVLGDEHPIISSTMDSIELVETAKHYAENPLSNPAFYMNKAAAACAVENPSDVMIEMIDAGIDSFDGMSPNEWLLNPCGPVVYNPQNDS